MSSRNYGDVIWTNHALERLQERNIRQSDAWVAFTKADSSRYAESKGGWVYNKTVNGWDIEVVAKQNEKKEWIILTVWANPVFWKEDYKIYKKKHWLIRILRRLFLADYR